MQRVLYLFYSTTLYCDHIIGPTLCYLKCPFISPLVSEGDIIINHEFIYNFIGVVYSVTISRILSLLIYD